MAMQVGFERIGVDVAKAELVIARSGRKGIEQIVNDRASIRRWLKGLSGPACLAVEATNRYHLLLIEEADAAGHQVYVLDGYRLNRYRESVGPRAKTDRSDAALLLRFLENEGHLLKPWTPPPAGYLTLCVLLRRRATLVQTRTQLQQSLADLPEAKAERAALKRSLNRLILALEKRIASVAAQTDRHTDIQRCQAIEGIGPITATALANTFTRGRFSGADAFIAFLGLDVRVRDSGKKKGKRCLTKQGDPELRRLLYNAAMSAKRHPKWAPFYERCLARGMATTQGLVALARKLARVAFTLMKNQSTYRSNLGELAAQT